MVVSNSAVQNQQEVVHLDENQAYVICRDHRFADEHETALVVDDPHVSRRHVELKRIKSYWQLKVSASNVVLVDSEEVKKGYSKSFTDMDRQVSVEVKVKNGIRKFIFRTKDEEREEKFLTMCSIEEKDIVGDILGMSDSYEEFEGFHIFVDVENSTNLTQEFGDKFSTTLLAVWEHMMYSPRGLVSIYGAELSVRSCTGDGLAVTAKHPIGVEKFIKHAKRYLGSEILGEALSRKTDGKLSGIRCRIGISYGNSHEGNRLNTNVGSAMNAAARIEGATKLLPPKVELPILASADAMSKLPFSPYGSITTTLKGFEEGERTLYRIEI